MRKNLDLKLSWYSPENWETLIEDGYLPILAIQSPKLLQGTPIHFPELSPKGGNDLPGYKEYLENKIRGWKIVNSLDVLSHISNATKGVVVLTNHQEDPFRETLGKYLGKFLTSEVTEYEYNRG